jgi:ABC-type branched-subunit amino acid transport system ATPase component
MKVLASQGTAVLFVDESTDEAIGIADRCYMLNGGISRLVDVTETFIESQ